VLLYSTVQSVATSILSFAFLGTSIEPLQVVGSLLVIGGLFVTVWSQRREAKLATGKDKRSATTATSPYGYTHGHANGNGSNGHHDGAPPTNGRIRSVGGGGYGVDEYDPQLMAGIDGPASLTSPVGGNSHTNSNGSFVSHHGRSGGSIISNGNGSSRGSAVITVDDLGQPLVHSVNNHHIQEEDEEE
jgi:hypothetical protein